MSNLTADQRAQLRKEVSNPANGSKDHLHKLSLLLLDELERVTEQRSYWHQMAVKLGDEMDAAEKRIAELSSNNDSAHKDLLKARRKVCQFKIYFRPK